MIETVDRVNIQLKIHITTSNVRGAKHGQQEKWKQVGSLRSFPGKPCESWSQYQSLQSGQAISQLSIHLNQPSSRDHLL